MAGPLNGVGSYQQAPISNTFQPGQNSDGTRQSSEQAARENVVQPRGAEAAETHNVSTNNQDTGVDLRNEGRSQELSGEPTGNEARGSLIDITV